MTVNKQYFTMIQVRNALEKIADRMAEDKWEPDVIMGINRGGCIPGIYLSHRLNKPHEALDVRLRDHKAKPDLRNLEKAYAFQKKILIIDDINDTGTTLKGIHDIVVMEGMTDNVKYVTLFEKMSSDFSVQICAKELDEEEEKQWIVFPYEEWWK